jgi:DNA-cytosine methyltransferase
LVLTVGDIYCGAGGFSEGFRQAGFKIKWAIDNWPSAAETFEKNQGVEVICDDVGNVDFKTLEQVDVIIGSPPCQNFSLAKKGGNGDVKEGMKLVSKFFEAVSELKPRYWIMENVPNLKKTLDCYLNEKTFYLPQGALEIPRMVVLNSADYGVPQRRRRLLMGKFPEPRQTHKEDGSDVIGSLPRWRSMKDIIDSLPHPLKELESTRRVRDAVYPIEISENELTEQSYNTYLTDEQVFLCRKTKEDHIWAGRMRFPDDLGSPSRTVTAQICRSGRQAIVIEDKSSCNTNYRTPTRRELACFQSFPIIYQFWGKTIDERDCLIGNAVPPLLAFTLAKAILEEESYAVPRKPKINIRYNEAPPIISSKISTMIGRNYVLPLNRPFRDYIPGSMSGHQKDACRVDLDNKGSNPKEHPIMGFRLSGNNDQTIKHIVEWRTVLYTGYAEGYRYLPIGLHDATRLIVQAEREDLLNPKIIESFIEDLKDLPYLVPDASTLQAVRARRCEKVNVTPYKLMDIISRKVDRHFPKKSFDWSMRIKNVNFIEIAPETGIPVRTAAHLLVCSFVCNILNESNIWIRKNMNSHFHKEEWPYIKDSFPVEVEWDGYATLKEEIRQKLKR